MKTLTVFIEELYGQELGASEYQTLEKIAVNSTTYTKITVAGSLIREVVFEDVIFENCTFFGSTLDNCLFINCLFINCKFQFSRVLNCNFELTTWENCIWGLTALKDSELIGLDAINNYGFESSGPGIQTQTLSLLEFLDLTA